MGDYDDDDFEDYDDEDFEDDAADSHAESMQSPTATQQVRQAMEEAAQQERHANAAARGPVAQPNFGGAGTRVTSMHSAQAQPVAMMATPKRQFIAPPSQATMQLQEQKAARLKALRGVLQLRNSVEVNLYDAPPLTPYELQTRHQSHLYRQKHVQTGDDDKEVGLQTEPIESEAQSCQWPEDGASGGGSGMQASASAKTASILSANVSRLTRFLSSAGQRMETLLSENLMAATGGAVARGFTLPNSLPFSARHCEVTLPAALGERPPHDLAFSSDGASLLVAYGRPYAPPDPPERKADRAALKRVASDGVLGYWKVHRTETPWAAMRVVGTPSCCLLPHAKPHLVVAGTDEGAVQLWDLREPGGSHPSIDCAGDRLALRSPSYTTDCLASTGAHRTPISAICALPRSGGDDEAADLSIASLDLEGTMIVWVVLEAAELDALDLGQAVGGKHRLLHSGAFELDASNRNGAQPAALAVLPTRTFGMGFVPSDPSRFLLATDTPSILHRSRYASAPPNPAAFTPDGAAFDTALAAAPPADAKGGGGCGATGIAFCPSSSSHFLAGRADGSVCLYHVDEALPLLVWDGFTSCGVAQLAWSPSRPSTFWVLDDDGAVHVFDLLAPSPAPALSSAVPRVPSVHAPADADGAADELGSDGHARKAIAAARKTRIALDGGAEAARADRGAQGGAPAPRSRMVAISTRGEDGRLAGVQVHLIVDKLAEPDEMDEERLQQLLNTL